MTARQQLCIPEALNLYLIELVNKAPRTHTLMPELILNVSSPCSLPAKELVGWKCGNRYTMGSLVMNLVEMCGLTWQPSIFLPGSTPEDVALLARQVFESFQTICHAYCTHTQRLIGELCPAQRLPAASNPEHGELILRDKGFFKPISIIYRLEWGPCV